MSELPKGILFLQPDPDQIRHQIRGILDSYSHDWDLLAELSQNAVDAIARQKPVKGHIQIEVNAPNRTINFRDNGSGIEPSNLTRLLRPFGSDKMKDSSQIGQKGVGLTFVVFSTSSFVLETHHDSGSSRATIHGARSWVDLEGEEDLLLKIEEIEPAEQGVVLKLILNDDNHPLWHLSHAQLEFLLRTKTAIGSTSFIWGDNLNCDFTLNHTDISGDNKVIERECEYMTPVERLMAHEKISIDEYETWLSDTKNDRSDVEKRRKLKDKVLYTSRQVQQAGRSIKYWACFVPKRAVWNDLSQGAGLISDQSENLTADEIDITNQFSSGLQTSTKGMPTGISLELKPRGAAGYFPNFFILIEDPALSFDIGRKAIQGRQQGMLRAIAYEQFREFNSLASKYIGGSVGDGSSSYDREELLEEVKSLPDLNTEHSQFVKRPNYQEATVAAMFFEQMGKGLFSPFEPYISGYKSKYDLFGRVGKRSFSIEFKTALGGLFKDFSDERKLFSEIDLVVIWDIVEDDWKQVTRRGLTLTEVKEGFVFEVEKRFPVVHYLLFLDGAKAIEIVSMRRLIKPEA